MFDGAGGGPAVVGCIALHQDLDELIAIEATSIGSAELLPLLDELMTATARLAGLVDRVIGEVDARGTHDEVGAISIAALLRYRFRMDPRAARRLADHADTVTRLLPAVGAAQLAGQVQPAQADALVASLDGIPSTTSAADRDQAANVLIDQCRRLAPTELRHAGTRLIEHLTLLSEDGEPPDDQAPDPWADRHVDVVRRDGGLAGTFFLPGEAGARVMALLDAWSAPDSQNHSDPDDADGHDTRSLAQRRADAFLAAIDHASVCKHQPGPPVPQILVTIDYDRLAERVATGTMLDTGQRLPAADLRRLACTAGLLPTVLNGDSLPLDLGRERRLFTTHQRRALALRDGGCTFGGCDKPPAACRAHHLDEWTAHDGPTTLANGALLCDTHHRLVHTQGWTGQIAANGHPEYRPPAWIDPTRTPRQHDRSTITRTLPRRR